MHVALDVEYDEQHRTGRSAAVVFEQWADAVAVAEYVAVRGQIAPYVPGDFYQRELPCLLAVLAKVREPISTAIIDGYVQLGPRPGLGMHLWAATDRQYPVIGVAKSPFRGAEPLPITRGKSNVPLYITAIGIDVGEAAARIEKMHGPYRIPTLLRRADQLAAG